MTKTQKNWLISLLAITLVGGATLGLVLPLTMCSVNPTPGPTPPPGPINNDLKPIGYYGNSATEDLDHPEVYISKDQNKDDANVLRYMEIKAGSNLQTTYGCSGWTVFGTKIETSFPSSCFDTDINVDTIPETVLINGTKQKIKNIGRFSSNNITSLIIPDFIEVIGNGAFSDCTGLTTLTIPTTVTSIGSGAFSLCNFTSLSIEVGNTKYALASSKSVGAASVVIDKEQYPDLNYDYASKPIGDLACGELTVWNDPSVSSINFLFTSSGISKVIIGDNITEIQESFNYCLNLTALDLSNALNLTTISMDPHGNLSCFYGCPKLTGELIIPAKLKQIQIGNPSQPAFSNSAFEKLIFKGSPSSNIEYKAIFNATIKQTTDFSIEVPLADRDAYVAIFSPEVSENKIIGV